MGADSRDFELIIRAGAEGLSSDLSKMAGMLRSFARTADTIAPRSDLGIDRKAAQEQSEQVRKLQGELKRAREAARETHLSFVDMAKGAVFGAGAFVALEAGLRGVDGILGQLKDSIAKASDFEQTKQGFEVMLQSGDKAVELLRDIRQYSAIAPFRNDEVQSAVRSLLAYGVAADQVIPTVKMLGDVSAAFGNNARLEDLTYLYGKTFSTQRVYAIEMREFALRGIPVWEELARVVGKTVQETKDMVEEGRIGRDEITKAFISMTSSGGRFEGMVAKQGQTLKGLWTTTQDSVDKLKIGLGQILIEELGLKQVSRDLANFADNVGGGLDRIRPGVRLVGDLAKGVAQVSYEFAKAGIHVADINYEGLVKAFPGIGNSLREFRELVSSIQDFRLDPKQVTHFALIVLEEAGGSLARLVDWADSTGSRYADDFRRNFVNPISELIATVKQAASDMDMLGKAAGNMWRGMKGDFLEDKAFKDLTVAQAREYRVTAKGASEIARETAWEQRVPTSPRAQEFRNFSAKLAAGDPKTEFWLPQRDMRPDYRKEFMQQYWQLNEHIANAKSAVDAGRNDMAETLAILVNRRNEILSAFGPGVSTPTGGLRDDVWGRVNHELLKNNRIPEFADGGKGTDFRRDPINAVERFQDFMRPFREAVMGREAIADAQRLADVQRQQADAVAASTFTWQKWTDVLNGGNQHGVRLQNDVNPAIFDLAKRANQEFGNPQKELEQFRQDLETAHRTLDPLTKKPLIDDFVFGKEWVKKVEEIANRMGIGGERKLSDAAIAGTVEDARLIQRFRAGFEGPQTTEGLLKMIYDLIKERFEKADRKDIWDDILGGSSVNVQLLG